MMTMRFRRLLFALLVIALAAAGCGADKPSADADQVVTGPGDDVDPVEAAPDDVPPPLERLPREGEADTFNAPDLTGLPIDKVLDWAEASGLSNVDVFDSPEAVESSSEFDPTRLLLVVQNGIVVDAEFG